MPRQSKPKPRLEVKDSTTGRVFTIRGQAEQLERSGEYQLTGPQGLALIVEDAEGLQVSTNEFTLNRGERTRIRVTLAPTDNTVRDRVVPIPSAHASAASSDREAIVWVLSNGGTVTYRQGNKEEHIDQVASLPAGDVQLVVLSLHAETTPGLDDQMLARFQGCRNIRTLFLLGEKITSSGLAHFRRCRNLTQLGLQGTSVSDEGLASFENYTSLEYLNLISTKVRGDGLVHFKGCTNLTGVVLSD